MEEIVYSRATLDDLDTIIDLRLIFAKEFSTRPSLESIQEFKKANKMYLEVAIPNNSFIVYLAKCGNEIAGMGGVVIRQQPGSFKNPSGRVGYMMNMYIFPFFRRKGICTKILNLLLTEASLSGIHAFELHASEMGEKVYVQNGFVKHTEPTYRKFV
jgi:predicted acetyltransferase